MAQTSDEEKFVHFRPSYVCNQKCTQPENVNTSRWFYDTGSKELLAWYLHNVTTGSTGEFVGSHCNGNRSIQIDPMVLKHNIWPSLPTINGKTSIFIISILYNITTNEVRHGLISSWSEWIFRRFGGFEQYRWVTISVQLPSSISGSLCFGFD